jgi:hypothetical protein
MAGKLPEQRRWHRPAQLRLAHVHGADGLPDQVRRDAATGGFNFGQLGHDLNKWQI